MATVKYVQTRDPDTGQLSERHLIEVIAENVIFEEENMTLPQKMDTKADKVIYGDDIISKGRLFNSTEGEGSIAFGDNVQALNKNSTAFGDHTAANSAEGTAIGRYNVRDTDEKYAFIIGNGSKDEKTQIVSYSDAFKVDWNGNVFANKFLNMEGHEALTTLKSIQVGDKDFALHGSKLHLVAGHNISLTPVEIESEEEDGSTSHTLQVTIVAGEGIPGDGSGGGVVEDGAHLPLIGGTEYGPVIFDTTYDRTKFTDKEKEIFIKRSPQYRDDMTQEEKDKLLMSMTYMPIVVGDPTGLHLNIDCNSVINPSLDSYNEKTRQGGNLYLNKSKGLIIMGASQGNGIVWNPKKRNGGTGISVSSAGTGAFGWGTGVSPTGQNSIALGSNTRANGSASFAIGDNTKANGVASIAEGIRTTAAGSAAHAEGGYTNTKAAYSHAEGYGTITGGLYSHIEGYGDNVTAAVTKIEKAIADKETFQEVITEYWEEENKFAFAAGENQHIEGRNNLSFGKDSHIEGVENLNQAEGSHIEGIANTNLGEYNHTEGGYSFTSGTYLHTEGFGGKNEGHYSHIFGYGNTSIGKYNSVGGMLNENKGNKNFIFGKHNLIFDDSIMAIGKDIYVKGNGIEKNSFIFGANIGITDGEFPIFTSLRHMGSIIFGSRLKINNTIANNTNFIFGSDFGISATDINNSSNNFIFVKGGNFSPFVSLDNNVIFGKGIELKLTKCINSIILQNNDSGTTENPKINNKQIKNSYIFGENIFDNVGQIIASSIINGRNKISNLTTRYTFISGWDNNIENGVLKSFIVGTNNQILESETDLTSLFLLGVNNIVNNTYSSFVLGNNITIDSNLKITNLTIFGNEHNIYNDISNGYIEGLNHTIKANSNGVIHIEGYDNYILPNANNIHIEGTLNTGFNSHIEGIENYGGGINNHIEGKNNIASDLILYIDKNLEEYYETEYNSENNHIEGYGSIAAGSYGHIEGGIGTKDISVLKEKLQLTKNELLLDQLDNYNLHIDLSEYSHTEGYLNFTNGSYSHIEGKKNIGLSVNSHIEGSNNIISGESNSSHIENFRNTILDSSNSHMEGYSDRIIGKDILIGTIENNLDILIEDWNLNPFSLIYNSNNSHLEGVNNFIYSNENSHIEGENNKAFNGKNNHTEGLNIINTSDSGHAEGVSSISINSSNITYEQWQENPFSYLTGKGGHLEGHNNWNENDYGHVEGEQNTVKGFAAHAQGLNTIAEGDYSFTFGNLTKAIGQHSFAGGNNNQAIGNYSVALGLDSIAQTNYSFVFGNGLISQGNNQVVLGAYNEITEEDEESLLVIGNGKDENARNTILRVTKDGMLQASSFATLDGSPIGGGAGEDLPVGTIIINQNPNKSGFEQGDWKKLGKKVIELLDDNDNTITYTTYYWQRIEHWIIPSEDEKYIKDGVFTPDEEGYWVDDPRPESEEYYKDLIEIEGGNT